MTLLRDVALALDQQRVEFAVIGGKALSAHGVDRAAPVTEILTTDGRVLSPLLWAILQPKATVDIRRSDPDELLRGLIRVRDDSAQLVEVVVGRWIWQEEAVERAENRMVDETTMPVLRAADLVLLDLDAGGAQDSWDVTQLLALAGQKLGIEVESRVHDLPAAARERWSILRSPSS